MTVLNGNDVIFSVPETYFYFKNVSISFSNLLREGHE